ncbi:MAG: hypothetical protein HY237_14985 [Acidobacteria bacterium]|nr:hypothetical protein [Acidobacteriota bacterium]
MPSSASVCGFESGERRTSSITARFRPHAFEEYADLFLAGELAPASLLGRRISCRGVSPARAGELPSVRVGSSLIVRRF